MGSFTANSVALQVPEIALVQLPFSLPAALSGIACSTTTCKNR